MKEIKLSDLWSEQDIQECKEKMPLLSKLQQRLMLDVLFWDIEKAIREKFPDTLNIEDCTQSILRKEFAFAYLP